MKNDLEEMSAACETSLLLDRAAGAPIPHVDLVEDFYRLGFAGGAAWALAKVKAEP